MSGFDKLLIKVNKYDVDKILFDVWSNIKVQLFIEQLNTEGQPTSQLMSQGVDSLGVSLGKYSPFTVQVKLSKNQRIDHITLKDTGEFYESWDIKPFLKGFIINAQGQKDDDNLFEIYGKDILGLTDENIKILSEFITPFYTNSTKKIVP